MPSGHIGRGLVINGTEAHIHPATFNFQALAPVAVDVIGRSRGGPGQPQRLVIADNEQIQPAGHPAGADVIAAGENHVAGLQHLAQVSDSFCALSFSGSVIDRLGSGFQSS